MGMWLSGGGFTLTRSFCDFLSDPMLEIFCYESCDVVMTFLRGLHSNSTTHLCPAHSEAAPSPTSSTPPPPGDLVRKSPFRVASSWIFPTCLKSSSSFSLLFVEVNAGPNTATYLFLLPSSVNSYSLQISQVLARWRRKTSLR